MRIVFFILVLLHSLIHLLGFVKGFGLKEVKELTLPISKPTGLFWFAATALFMIYGILYFTNNKYAWLAGLVAVVLSQSLVILFWKDARFGTIPNLIILMVSMVGMGLYLLKSDFTDKVKNDFSENNVLSTEVLTEKDIAHLPLVVQKYLYYTNSVGQPKVKNFRSEFVGGMRGKPREALMKFRSVQYNFYQEPSRYFFMEASKMGLPATGLHLYQKETSTFEVKIMNWLKVVDAKGDKMNQGETVTLFNDMCCIAPATLIDRRITWQTLSDTEVKAIYKNGNITISALLYFNQQGALVNFISNDRYETDGKHYKNYPWSTLVEDYKMLNGYLLPSKAKLIYNKPEGDFTYGEFEYKSLKYNLNAIEQ